jgi:hypothetical protein
MCLWSLDYTGALNSAWKGFLHDVSTRLPLWGSFDRGNAQYTQRAQRRNQRAVCGAATVGRKNLHKTRWKPSDMPLGFAPQLSLHINHFTCP